MFNMLQTCLLLLGIRNVRLLFWNLQLVISVQKWYIPAMIIVCKQLHFAIVYKGIPQFSAQFFLILLSLVHSVVFYNTVFVFASFLVFNKFRHYVNPATPIRLIHFFCQIDQHPSGFINFSVSIVLIVCRELSYIVLGCYRYRYQCLIVSSPLPLTFSTDGM